MNFEFCNGLESLVESHHETRESLRENTVQAVFHCVDGLSATWGSLHFCHGTEYPSLNDHFAFITLLAKSSLGGMDTKLQFRFEYEHLGVRPIRISLDFVGYLWISLDFVGYERISLGYLWAK